MKLLQIINSLDAGGAEKLVVDMIIEYHKKNIDTAILLLVDKQTNLLSKLQEISGIKIYSLNQN